jgi:hypothetical protein
VIFARCPFLDHAFSRIIENEYRERAMQETLLVSLQLAARAESPVRLIYKYDLLSLIIHQNLLRNASMLIIH